MLGHRKFDLQDWIGIVSRRYWVILAPVIICPVLALVAARVLPPRYVSTGLIFIDRPTVPAEVVRPMTSGDLIQRINAIQEQVLSRTRLEPLVGKYRLQPGTQRISGEAINELRKAIVIAPAEFASLPGGSEREPIPGLSISCTARSALTAQELCMDITTGFIEESLEQREQLEQGTSDFLSVQLAEAKQKLDAEDAKLADLKSRNLGRLPDDQETNLRVLMDRNAQLEAANEALDRAAQDRTYTQSLLQQQLSSSKAAGSAPAATVDELQDELSKKQQLLSELEAHYTAKYPEVATLKTAVEDLKKQIAARAVPDRKSTETSAASPLEGKSESPQVLQLRAQIHQDDEIIRTRTEEQAHLKQQISEYEQKLQLSPVVEEEIKNLTRDHETALHFYNDLLQRKNETQMSASLEQREQGERFRILDSPNLPDNPDFPKRSLFIAGGLGGGIALGLAMALFLEMLDKSIRDERDIEVLLKIHNVATLPAVQSLKGWKGDPPSDRLHEERKTLTIKA